MGITVLCSKRLQKLLHTFTSAGAMSVSYIILPTPQSWSILWAHLPTQPLNLLSHAAGAYREDAHDLGEAGGLPAAHGAA